MTPVANKDLQSWVRFDVNFFHNPKSRRAGLFGRSLYWAAMCWSYRQNSDGEVSADVLDILAAEAGLTMEQAQEAASKLMEVGLWEREPDGWHIHDYEHCQETSEERDARRQQDRARQRKHRAKVGTRGAPASPETPVTRDTGVTNGGVIDPEPEADTEDIKHTCRVEPPNADPSQPPSVEMPPDGGHAQTTTDGFAQFWDTYPKRNGRKVNKAAAQAQWRKLKPTDRSLALTAVEHYATERGGPDQTSAADAHRWLRDRAYVEWAEPPDETPGGRDRRALTARLAALTKSPTAHRGA